jgi:serine protease Do
VITAAGGRDIKTVHELPRLVASAPVGSKLQLTMVRDGKQKTVEVSIGENVASSETQAAQPGNGKAVNAFGMELLPLDPQLRQELKAPKDLNGVVVGQVASGSPAGDLGIQPGDVIVSVDQKPVTTPENAATQLKAAAVQGNVLLLLNRHGMNRFVGLRSRITERQAAAAECVRGITIDLGFGFAAGRPPRWNSSTYNF